MQGHSRAHMSSHELKEPGWSQWKASGHVGHFFTEQKRMSHFSQNRNKLNFHWRRRWWLRFPQRVREQSLASPELRCTLFTDSKVSLAVLARKRREKRSSGCAHPNGGFLCFLCKPENTENPPPCPPSLTIVILLTFINFFGLVFAHRRSSCGGLHCANAVGCNGRSTSCCLCGKRRRCSGGV